MDTTKILSMVDHTLLLQTSTWEEIRALCDDAIHYGTASVCIPPCFVQQAKEYVGNQMKICTVIGFPNGNHTTATKVFETIDAINNGADEIDMVINVGMLKAKNYDYVLNEIREIKDACGDKILKVIIETCLLTDEEKIKMCEIVTESGADFIKTSTGFGGGGATEEDVSLFKRHLPDGLKIKASGGIKTFEQAAKFLLLGCDRIGASGLLGNDFIEEEIKI